MLNLNTPNKQWNMYLNTLSSISGDDLTIKPDTRRNLILEVSGNNNIFIKKGDVSYNLSNLIRGDFSFSNVDVSNNLNPLTNNNSSLGLPSKLWGNAYIRDISVTNISISGNMSISGTISNVIQIIPRLANDISLGSATNTWQKAFISDLSGISRINGSTWPLAVPTGPAGPAGPTGPTGPTGPIGPELRVNINTTLTDISNFRITTNRRIYQNICGDISWNAVNGYYGLAINAYPSLNPLSSGELAVKTWTSRVSALGNLVGCCWSPELRLFVCVQSERSGGIIISPNGINWTLAQTYPSTTRWSYICWSPQLKLFVATATSAPNGRNIATSTDGNIWTLVPISSEIPSYITDICWSAELGMFVAVTEQGIIITSINGYDWIRRGINNFDFDSICWSAELNIFVVTAYNGNNMRISKNGIDWITITINTLDVNTWIQKICWSSNLGIFVIVSMNGPHRVATSIDGINWIPRTQGVELISWTSVCWSPQLVLFIAISAEGSIMTSPNGIIWKLYLSGVPRSDICWSPELGIFVVVGGGVMTSSLKGRPPTSYNVFDSSFNRIDENGKWDFSNINVTTLSVNNVNVTSDDRLKHNEIVITNGLDVIDKLTPKFYQKTQVLLDAHYNGDLSNYAWIHEAGLIAQELLKISDLSYVVSGGDYYEQTYKYITQTNDLSNSYYDLSNSYYDLSNSYYEPSANNYEISNNLIAQAYNVNYNSVFVYGLAAIKELHTKVKAKEISILNRQAIINSLITRIEALESNIQDVSNNNV